jgi:hypothetical protein
LHYVFKLSKDGETNSVPSPMYILMKIEEMNILRPEASLHLLRQLIPTLCCNIPPGYLEYTTE